MVAVLARLKLSLLLRAARQSPWRMAGLILGAAFGALVVVLWAMTMALTGTREIADLQVAVVLSLAGVLTSWVILPVLLFGVDETLDPKRFALLPLRAGQLRPGLLVAGFVGVPGVLTALLSLTPALGWFQHGTSAGLVALLMAPVFTVSCFLAARAVTTGFAAALASRRFKDFAAVVLGVLILGIALVMNVLSGQAAKSPEQAERNLRTGADVMGWTPFGWAAAVPGDVARGAWGVAAARMALALGLAAVLWVLWGRLLSRALTSITEGGSSDVGERSRQIDRLYGPSPVGAIAARCLRYWRRDPRYLTSLVSFAILPLMMGASLSLSSGGAALLFIPMMMAALTGPALTSELAYDNSALWVHVTSGVAGRADRLGRALAQVTVIGPMIVLTFLGALIMSGEWGWALGVLAVTISLLLTGAAIGLTSGSINPGGAPAPGDSPFATGGAGGLLTIVIFFVGIGGAVVLSLPVIIPLLLWGEGAVLVQFAALLVALVWGGLVFRTALTWSGRRLERRWPELFARVTT